MQLNGFKLWSQRCMIEYWKFVQYVAVLDDSRWLKRALVWNAGGGRLGRSFDLWETPVTKFCRWQNIGEWELAAQDKALWLQYTEDFVSFMKVKILQQQLPNLTAQILPQLQRAEGAPPAIHAALQAAAALTTTEWTPPNWTDLLDGARPSTELAQEDPQPHHRGWQQTAVTQVHRRFRTELQATLRRPGDARVSIRPLCQQSFRHCALHCRLHLPQPPLPSPLATQASSPPPSHSTCLSVPSRFRPSWRPPCSMPEIRGTSKQRHPFGASSSPRLQTSWSQSHYTHPTFRSQHPHSPPHRQATY